MSHVTIQRPSSLGVVPTSFSDWEKIDSEEQRVGRERGKPREKVVSLCRMMDIVKNHNMV